MLEWFRTFRNRPNTALAGSTDSSASSERTGVGLAHITPDSLMLRVNRRLAAILGHSEGILVGKRFRDFIHRDDLTTYERATDAFRDVMIDTFGVELRMVCANGDALPVRLTGSVVRNDEGAARFAVLIVEDIRDHKHAEANRELLLQVGARLSAARDRETIIALLNASLVPGVADLCVVELTGQPAGRSAPVPNVHQRISVPLDTGQHGLGQIQLVMTAPERHFLENDLALARAVALRAAIALERAELFERLDDALAQAEEQAEQLESQAIELEEQAVELEIANQELGDALHEMESARDQVAASAIQYRGLFDSNPLPMWVYDRDTLAFLSVNRAAIEQYGYSREEFLAMTLVDIRPSEDVDRLYRAVADSKDLERSSDWHHRRKDGTVIDVEIVAHCIAYDGRNAELVVAHDVTERKRAEARLRESTALLNAVVDDSPVAIIAVNSDLEIIRWNPAAEQLLGWTSQEVIGTSFLRLIPPERTAEFQEFQARLRSGGRNLSIDTERCSKDGTRVDVNVSIARLHDANGQENGWLSVMKNITERKQMEAQLRQSQKMEAVGQLAGGVAHDFNNLLTAIASYSELVLEAVRGDQEVYDDVVEIKRAADRAALLTRQLLAFSRQQVARTEILSVNDVVADLDKLLRRVVRENIAFRLALTDKPVGVAADRAQLEQVIINLVVNARDAMPEGGTITITTESESNQLGDFAVVAVGDTGNGISDEIRERIFEPFFTTKDAGSGTGLGLSIVQGIVTQAGGHIAVASAAGCGTTFRAYLPRVPLSATAERSLLGPHTAQPGDETILMVEDDHAVREVTVRALKKHGYNILAARTGSEALEIFESHKEHIALAITDLVMPGIPGIELALELRSRNPNLPILFMSGYSKDAGRELGQFEPYTDYLEKPFTPARLQSTVRKLLDERPAG
jgi:two-component system, cell cycle sensor histidine kinase and response regulator CckA